MLPLLIAHGLVLALLTVGVWKISRIWRVPGISLRQRWVATSPLLASTIVFVSMALLSILNPSDQWKDAYFPVMFIAWGMCAIVASLVLFFFAADLASVILALKKHRPVPSSIRLLETKTADPKKLIRTYRIGAVGIFLAGLYLVSQNLG